MLAKVIPLTHRERIRGFARVLGYILRIGSEKALSRGESGDINLKEKPLWSAAEDLEAYAREVTASWDDDVKQCRRRGRFKGNPAYHVAIAWAHGEHPTREQADRAARHVMKALGFAECQAMWAIHRDTDHDHLHLVINRVHPTKLTAVSVPRRDYLTLDRCMRELEIELGFARNNGPYVTVDTPEGPKVVRMSREERAARGLLLDEEGPRLSARAQRAEHNLQGDSFQRWVAGKPATALRQSIEAPGASWQRAHEVLARFGLVIQLKGSGAVVTTTLSDGRTLAAKASAMGRWASKASLERVLGVFEPPSPDPSQTVGLAETKEKAVLTERLTEASPQLVTSESLEPVLQSLDPSSLDASEPVDPTERNEKAVLAERLTAASPYGVTSGSLEPILVDALKGPETAHINRAERASGGPLLDEDGSQVAARVQRAEHNLQGGISFQRWVAGKPATELRQSIEAPGTSWQRAHEVLARFGLAIELKGSGAVVTTTLSDGRKLAAKASIMGRWASKASLEGVLGSFNPPNPTASGRLDPTATHEKSVLGARGTEASPQFVTSESLEPVPGSFDPPNPDLSGRLNSTDTYEKAVLMERLSPVSPHLVTSDSLELVPGSFGPPSFDASGSVDPTNTPEKAVLRERRTETSPQLATSESPERVAGSFRPPTPGTSDCVSPTETYEQAVLRGRLKEASPQFVTSDPQRLVQRAERAEARRALSERFSTEQARLRVERSRAWQELRSRHARERRALLDAHRAQRRQLRAASNVQTKRYQIAASLWAFGAAAERELLQRRHGEERRALARQLPRSEVWRVWLERQAATGDPAAISALRGIRYRQQRQRKRQDGIEGEELAEQPPLSVGALKAEVAWRMVIYRSSDGRELFRDMGPRIVMCDKRRDSVEAALRIAAQKYGSHIKLTGSDEFRERAARIATGLGLAVNNPELEAVVADEMQRRRVPVRQIGPVRSSGRNQASRSLGPER